MKKKNNLWNKVSNKNKKILIILASTLLVALIIFATLIIVRKTKENIVIKELNKINELDVATDEIDMNIKSSGELKIVEEAIKNYYKDFFNLKKTMNDNRAEALLNILTPEYLGKNKSKLNDVKKELEEKNKNFEDNIDNLIEMLKDYKIISYIDKTKISKHNYEFYKSLMITEDDKVIIKDLEGIKKNNQEKYGYVNEIIGLLTKNSSYWYIKDNKLYIDGKNLLNKYNELRNKVYDLEESK